MFRLIICIFLLLVTNCNSSKKKSGVLWPLLLTGSANTKSTANSEAPSISISTGTEQTALLGTAFSLKPNVSGTITSCSISPILPNGLTINSSTCEISGTPLEKISAVSFTIKVCNQTSCSFFSFRLTVKSTPDSKDILTFGFISPAISGSINGTNITMIVPYGTSLTSLIASFTISGSSVNISGVNQVSGSTINNFSTPKTYTVVAEDLSTKNYNVTVTTAPGYSIGGNLTSLPTGNLTLYLNGGNSILKTSTGAFTFALLLGTGSSYTVTASPSNGSVVCNLTNSSGTISSANISNISVSCIMPVCGNGIIESGELCDDNNATPGDGCNSSCQIEPGYSCNGQPSICSM